MTEQSVQDHYTTRLAEAASQYEKDPSAASAWSLVQALALGRLFGADRSVYEAVFSAVMPHQGDIFEASLDDALGQDYAASVDAFVGHADYAVEEWEDRAQDIRMLLLELQAAHDWLADQVLDSPALLPRLIERLEQLGSSVSELCARMLEHRELFHVAEDLERQMLSAAVPEFVTDAYNVLTSELASAARARTPQVYAIAASDGADEARSLAESVLAYLNRDTLDEILSHATAKELLVWFLRDEKGWITGHTYDEAVASTHTYEAVKSTVPVIPERDQIIEPDRERLTEWLYELTGDRDTVEAIAKRI